MAQAVVHSCACVVLLLALMGVLAEAARTPPGITNNPCNARCLENKFKECYNLVHVCPKFCPDSCTVHCQSCKPICSGRSVPSDLVPVSSTPPPALPTPLPVPDAPTPPVSSTPSPSQPTPLSPHVVPTPSPPTVVPTPETPSTTPARTPPSTPMPTSTTASSPKTAKCTDPRYSGSTCYNSVQKCFVSCPDGCEVDCYTCTLLSRM